MGGKVSVVIFVSNRVHRCLGPLAAPPPTSQTRLRGEGSGDRVLVTIIFDASVTRRPSSPSMPAPTLRPAAVAIHDRPLTADPDVFAQYGQTAAGLDDRGRSRPLSVTSEGSWCSRGPDPKRHSSGFPCPVVVNASDVLRIDLRSPRAAGDVVGDQRGPRLQISAPPSGDGGVMITWAP